MPILCHVYNVEHFMPIVCQLYANCMPIVCQFYANFMPIMIYALIRRYYSCLFYTINLCNFYANYDLCYSKLCLIIHANFMPCLYLGTIHERVMSNLQYYLYCKVTCIVMTLHECQTVRLYISLS